MDQLPSTSGTQKRVTKYNRREGDTDEIKRYNALLMPLHLNFERTGLRMKIKYEAPCGIVLCDMSEVRQFLSQAKGKNIDKLDVDNFSFDPFVDPMRVYVVHGKCPMKKEDFSEGIENGLPIRLVNTYDDTLPPPFTYIIDRMPTAGVNLNLDPEFLCGCDCNDDCADKSKCACWQLTLAGEKYVNPMKRIDDIGYVYKRLLEKVPTGIYECNERCKCNKKCLNRVAQKPYELKWKLHVFKTEGRGWGVQSLCDIPKGSFIACYTGEILTNEAANQLSDDTYFANLDHIEMAEKEKDGYEPVAEAGAERMSVDDNDDDDDDDATRKSIRKLYGQNESEYVMNGNKFGNFTRFFNHSCVPNMFVQNVFIDTHDLRFPWMAFFTSNRIKAGDELTWDYHYQVGNVPGKELMCKCGAKSCHGRLL